MGVGNPPSNIPVVILTPSLDPKHGQMLGEGLSGQTESGVLSWLNFLQHTFLDWRVIIYIFRENNKAIFSWGQMNPTVIKPQRPVPGRPPLSLCEGGSLLSGGAWSSRGAERRAEPGRWGAQGGGGILGSHSRPAPWIS